jgi:hypothetical protein
MKAGITVIDCEARESAQTTPDNLKSSISWQQHRQEIIQFVHLWHWKSPFLKKGLENFSAACCE